MGIYQQALLAHHQKPIGFERDIQATGKLDGHNAACGDDITVQIKVADSVIIQSAFSGESCAICRASASIMCQQLEQLSIAGYHLLSSQLMASLNGEQDFSETFLPLSSIANYPIRLQCALLPWQTLDKLLLAHQELN
ncbi:MAG: iron-sulfur cluster assembly scaffold protein [Colwellia sp.]|nr:iron-sulfur cluster assembly scaffold protein [Colwellia sp.]